MKDSTPENEGGKKEEKRTDSMGRKRSLLLPPAVCPSRLVPLPGAGVGRTLGCGAPQL